MKNIKYRHFLGLQASQQQQITLQELRKFTPQEASLILGGLKKATYQEDISTYKSYESLYPNLGRLRVSNFRVYTLHIGQNYYVILHIYKKSTQKMPSHVQEKIIKRAKFYQAQLAQTYEKKYNL